MKILTLSILLIYTTTLLEQWRTLAQENLGSGSKCPHDQEWTDCSPVCEKSCSRPDPVCSKNCTNPGGCRCKADTFLAPDGRCVRAYDCPPISCGPNATASTCTPTCERWCGGPHFKCPSPPSNCLDGRNRGPYCKCLSNYIRLNPGGPCISESDCSALLPKKCPKNEVWSACNVKLCEATCSNPNPICPLICNQPGGCKCANGYVRNSYRVCIPLKKCYGYGYGYVYDRYGSGYGGSKNGDYGGYKRFARSNGGGYEYGAYGGYDEGPYAYGGYDEEPYAYGGGYEYGAYGGYGEEPYAYGGYGEGQYVYGGYGEKTSVYGGYGEGRYAYGGAGYYDHDGYGYGKSPSYGDGDDDDDDDDDDD